MIGKSWRVECWNGGALGFNPVLQPSITSHPSLFPGGLS
jgi:hypothetical protein